MTEKNNEKNDENTTPGKVLLFPAASPLWLAIEGGDLPAINVEPGKLHQMATKGEEAIIAAGVDIFQRGSMLVRPVIDEIDASKGRKTKSARLVEVGDDMMRDLLSRHARWERFDRRTKKIERTDPPKDVSKFIRGRDGEWRVRKLAGVITSPTMRPDGSVFSEPGYDAVTHLVLFDPPLMPALIENPTREDALEALALLESLLVEFPFVDGASKSVALSGQITPVVRGAIGVAPLHSYRAPVPGSGKSYLVDVSSAITTGRLCPVIAAGKTEEETEKRLGGALLQGYPIISIDNLNGELGGDALCQLIERQIVSVRALGSSKMHVIENRATVYATGNNIMPTGDVIRRVIMCSLDPNLERPELRKFRGDPVATVLEDRGKYIAAAMTIVRAWIGAKLPDPVTPLASFEDWSHLVRSAMIWLGKEDPVSTMETARDEDPELQMLRAVVAAWKEAAGTNNPLTSGGLKALADEARVTGGGEYYQRTEKEWVHPDFHQALLDVAGKVGEIDAQRLGCNLGRWLHRIVDGLKIEGEKDNHSKQKRWWLKPMGGGST